MLGLTIVVTVVANCITPKERPLAESRIVVGKNVVSKKTLFHDDRLGGISSVARIGESELAVVGEQGAARVGLDGTLRSFTIFDDSHYVARIVPIDIDGDGTHEFLNRGGGWQPVSLIRPDGKTLWRYPQKRGFLGPAPNEVSFAGLENGRPTFVVGMNGADGVRVLNAEGKVIREFDGINVFSVAVGDVLPNEGLELIHSDREYVRIRARNGRILRTLRLPARSFTLLNGMGAGPVKDPTFVVVGEESNAVVYFFAPDGSKRATYDLPSDAVTEVDAVELSNGSEKLVAITHELWDEKGSVLYLFADGRLVYQEVLAASRLALWAPKDSQRSLYVGAEDELLQYTVTAMK